MKAYSLNLSRYMKYGASSLSNLCGEFAKFATSVKELQSMEDAELSGSYGTAPAKFPSRASTDTYYCRLISSSNTMYRYPGRACSAKEGPKIYLRTWCVIDMPIAMEMLKGGRERDREDKLLLSPRAER
jgi:hypothetical protein